MSLQHSLPDVSTDFSAIPTVPRFGPFPSGITNTTTYFTADPGMPNEPVKSPRRDFTLVLPRKQDSEAGVFTLTNSRRRPPRAR